EFEAIANGSSDITLDPSYDNLATGYNPDTSDQDLKISSVKKAVYTVGSESGLGPTNVSSGNNVSLSFAPLTAPNIGGNGEFEVSVMADSGGFGVSAIDLDIGFNNSVLEAKSVVLNLDAFPAPSTGKNVFNNSVGTLTVGGLNLTDTQNLKSGVFKIADIVFKVKQEGSVGLDFNKKTGSGTNKDGLGTDVSWSSKGINYVVSLDAVTGVPKSTVKPTAKLTAKPLVTNEPKPTAKSTIKPLMTVKPVVTGGVKPTAKPTAKPVSGSCDVAGGECVYRWKSCGSGHTESKTSSCDGWLRRCCIPGNETAKPTIGLKPTAKSTTKPVMTSGLKPTAKPEGGSCDVAGGECVYRWKSCGSGHTESKTSSCDGWLRRCCIPGNETAKPTTGLKPTAKSTVFPAGNTSVLSFKIAFKGVRLSSECAVGWPVKVMVMSGENTKTYENVIPNRTGEVNSNGEAVYRAEIELVGFGYRKDVAVFVKGLKHLQTKYGEDGQNGFYGKAGGKLDLSEGKTFDFSESSLLPGDVASLVGSNIRVGADGWINGVDFKILKEAASAYREVEAGGNLIEDLDGSCQVNGLDTVWLVRSLDEKQGQLY
ncbi:cohesin domain-containing protein, partial [Patescibacteria group bacterium]|nr:cohesin domain-containing protein [Patescibacteria group bacterium]